MCLMWLIEDQASFCMGLLGLFSTMCMHILTIWKSTFGEFESVGGQHTFCVAFLFFYICLYVWYIGIFHQEMHSCGFVLLFWISVFYDKYRWHSRAFHCWRSPSLIPCWPAGSSLFFYISDDMVENSTVEGHTPCGRLGQNWHLVSGQCAPHSSILGWPSTEGTSTNKFTMSSPATMKMFIARKKIRLQQGLCSLILTTTAAAATTTTMTTITTGLKVLK